MAHHQTPPRFRRFSRFAQLALVAALSLGASQASAVGTRHFVIESGADFRKGELEGVAVDSKGFLRPGWDLGNIAVPGAQNVWAAMEDKGSLYLATGNEGKLIVIRDGKVSELASVKALALTSIVQAFGRVLVGTMPGGKIYELKGDKLELFTELKEGEHIWDMSFDKDSKALYVVTGPQGKLYRVTADGTAQVYFDAPEDHLVSVVARQGRVIVGSSGDARVYEVKAPGRAQVLYDFSSTEVRDLALSKAGSIFVISNELSGNSRTDSLSGTKPRGMQKKSANKGKGALHRIHRNGQVEELFTDSKEQFVTLELDSKGRPIVGTGYQGRVIRVELNHHHSVLADVEGRQVRGVVLPGKDGWVVASDPVVAHRIESEGGKDSLWTSKVLDAGIRARFGRLSWDAVGRVEFSTRSGNSEKPDETWEDWSTPMDSFGKVQSQAGRYLQVRARLVDGTRSRVRRIDVPFVTDNLRPVITKIKVKSKIRTKDSHGVQESGGPIEKKPSSVIKLSWEVDNPDEDTLRYRVQYRLTSGKKWLNALDPREVLTEDSWKWNTEDLPEGRYRVRIIASDELSNPPRRAKKNRMVSEVLLVDNTAPKISKLRVQGSTIVGTAIDGVGPLARFEMRAPGQAHWTPFEPRDGIFDQARESFSVDSSSLNLSAAGLVTVRIFDSAGNSAVQHIRVPGASPVKN